VTSLFIVALELKLVGLLILSHPPPTTKFPIVHRSLDLAGLPGSNPLHPPPSHALNPTPTPAPKPLPAARHGRRTRPPSCGCCCSSPASYAVWLAGPIAGGKEADLLAAGAPPNPMTTAGSCCAVHRLPAGRQCLLHASQAGKEGEEEKGLLCLHRAAPAARGIYLPRPGRKVWPECSAPEPCWSLAPARRPFRGLSGTDYFLSSLDLVPAYT
jgi:hypothetical protein